MINNLLHECLKYLMPSIITLTTVYFIKYKSGYYPEHIRAILKSLVNKLPDKKWLPMQSQETVVEFVNKSQVNKNIIVTEKYSIRHWFNFIFSCPFCLSFWIYLIAFTGYIGLLHFIIIQTTMTTSFVLFKVRKSEIPFLSITLLLSLAIYSFNYIGSVFTVSILFAMICQELIFKNRQDLWQADLE